MGTVDRPARVGWLAAVLLVGHLALTGCSKPPAAALDPPATVEFAVDPDTATPADVAQTVAVTVAPVAEEIADTVEEIVDDIPLPEAPPPPPASATPLSRAGIKLLVDTEVGGEALYRRKFTRPVWPGGASGVTIGIGVDLGQMGEHELRYDWERHPQVDALVPAIGIAGLQAKALTARMQHIVTEFPLALDVFLRNDVLQYYRIAARAFPGLEQLGPNAQGALVSLVFNRGGSMPARCLPGNSRWEMCQIRDQCMPDPPTAGRCIAHWERMMKRVWKGKAIERGMNSRREQEAKLAELPDV